AHVLVDELQDTNRLQSDLLDLVSDGNLFTVGDELQSIYGFRGADVGVFAERREAAAPSAREARLGTTFRAPRGLADVLNAAFAPIFGERFSALEAADDAGSAPRVELLAVDRDNGSWEAAARPSAEPFGAGMRGVPAWRAAEARLLAARIDELVEGGEFAPGEVAVLVRSWSDVDRYERALSERGLATYVAGGGGLWAGREVADVRAYLALLANPGDEAALVAALASSLVGASLDALALLGMRARGGPGLWATLAAAVDAAPIDAAPEGAIGERARRLREELPAFDRERLAAFVRRIGSERAEAPRLSLAALIERVVTASGYARHVLALPGGERRMANLRKLKRLAREFEAAEGRDLRGFLDALEARARSPAREGEAPLEGEGVAAVRLMTIHAAKGLEFPLVCVADLGRGDPPASVPLRVAGDGRVGLRLPDPEGGPGLGALDAASLAEEAAKAEESEERRLMWVATTRAERRLIVSGALDLERAGPNSPMDWIGPALVPELRDAVAAGRRRGVAVHRWEGRTAAVVWRAVTPASLEVDLPASDRVPAHSVGAAKRADARAPLALPLAAPSAAGTQAGVDPPTRVSYSALEAYGRCAYRFHLERVLGLPAEDDARPGTPACGDGSLPARVRGSVVHELLERTDLRRPATPTDAEISARIVAHGGAPGRADIDDLRRLVAGFLETPLRRRMARAGRVRPELPFAFPLAVEGDRGEPASILVEGVIDSFCDGGDGALVVDYKSDRVDRAADLEGVCEGDYSTQRLVYALAGLRGGADRVEVVHVFLERPHEPATARYARADVPRLERRLAALVGGLVAGRHAPTEAPGPDVCAGCSGRAALCSWPPERTGVSHAIAA
ncbi:MAG TPA: 3'-5' exonuclease, partial [Thermoleophilaceae bacterium]|nr:3'-5' exonuclease [Thermoleophilaceae bacterium]